MTRKERKGAEKGRKGKKRRNISFDKHVMTRTRTRDEDEDEDEDGQATLTPEGGGREGGHAAKGGRLDVILEENDVHIVVHTLQQQLAYTPSQVKEQEEEEDQSAHFLIIIIIYYYFHFRSFLESFSSKKETLTFRVPATIRD